MPAENRSMFKGLSAFPITPCGNAHSDNIGADDGIVDVHALERLLAPLIQARVHSIGLLGSTGIYAFLSASERKRAVEAAVSFIAGRTPLIVGVGALRTRDAIHLAKHAQHVGADGLLMAPMSYTPLTDDEVYAHYLAVAKATDLPLCIYNNPGTTKFNFSHQLIARLARVDTIKAIKMPLPADSDFKAEINMLRHSTPDDFAIGYSADWGCAKALLAGADCWFSVVGGILPHATLKLAYAARSADREKVIELEAAFRPLWALFQEFGSLRVVYVIANILSLSDAKPPLPIQPLGKLAQNRIQSALEGLI